MKQISEGWKRKGFALPTVLIASVVMMMVLLAGLVVTSSSSVAVRNQGYDQLAQEAAEAGIGFMRGCLDEYQYNALPTTGTFRPNSTSCLNAATTTSKTACVVTSAAGDNNGNYRTTFEVSPPTVTGNYYLLSAVGKVELFRASATQTCPATGSPSGTPIKTITRNLSFRVQFSSLAANTSSSGSLMVCGLVNLQSYCWGRNVEGQLGNGTATPEDQPYFWGDGERYDNNGNRRPVVVKVLRNSDTGKASGLKDREIDIAAGAGFACAITTISTAAFNSQAEKDARNVVCWGQGDTGQLGRSDRPASTTVYPEPTLTHAPWRAASPSPQAPTSIEASGSTVCITTDPQSDTTRSNIWCWGGNGNGQVGNDTTTTPYTSPQQVLGPGSPRAILGVIAMSPSAPHVCGMTSAGTTFCWGNNQYGQNGNGVTGTNNRRMVQVQVSPGNTPAFFSAIAVGGSMTDNASHSCGIGRAGTNMTAGKIYCWGSNEYGTINRTLGTGPYPRAVVVGISSMPNYVATQIGASNQTACAVVKADASATTSSLWCWGGNARGELGRGDSWASTVSTPTPGRVAFFDGRTITDLNGGAYRMCAVANGSNYCWGADHVGQVGDGSITSMHRSPSKSLFLEPPIQPLTY